MSYKSYIKKVGGRKVKDIFVFALSTCGWCAKTKALLNELGAEYSYVDVDLLNDEDQNEVEKEFNKLKTDFAFPKVIINNKKVISGYDEEIIRRECN